VLLFNSSSLCWRHEDMVRNGASHDYDDYQPHVTITYEGSDLDSVEGRAVHAASSSSGRRFSPRSTTIGEAVLTEA
jgi:hypothetical protein